MIYRYIKVAEDGGLVERKVGSGRPSHIATKSNISQVCKMMNNSSSISQKMVARKLNCTQQYVSKILKKYTSIKCRRKCRQPKRTIKQIKERRPKCRKMYYKYKNKTFILDDESYFTLANTTLSGNDIYYSDNPENAPDDVKFKLISKYEPKVLVWIAISELGMSAPYFAHQGQAINQKIYLNTCIKPKLIPFIKKHKDYVFWPDLASSHYAKSVIEYFNENNICYVPKIENPANVPESRPIEDFWGDLKREVYKKNWRAKNVEQLIRRIRYCLRKMDVSFIQGRALEVHKRLDSIARKGYHRK